MYLIFGTHISWFARKQLDMPPGEHASPFRLPSDIAGPRASVIRCVLRFDDENLSNFEAQVSLLQYTVWLEHAGVFSRAGPRS